MPWYDSMSTDRFTLELETLRKHCDSALLRLLGHGSSEFSATAEPHLARLFEASAYSLTCGGKRLRPALVHGAATAVAPSILDADSTAVDYAATAAEMMHAYSLVHDDLPAMDDADLRRGRPACHIAFDEPTAILVGDGLQARAYELLTDAPGLSDAARLELVRVLSAAAGARGMAGGQAIDIAAVDLQISLEHLQTMHALKTGALIRASVALGAIVAGASRAQRDALDDYADAIGLAFQITDDILDATSDSLTLGKQAGVDATHNKPTYVSLLGLPGARDKANALLEEALAALTNFGATAWFLRELATYIVNRSH